MGWAFLERWEKVLRLVGIAKGDRDATTVRVEKAFGEAGAFITDVHMFSGVQTVLTFEVPSDRVRALALALTKAGLSLDEASAACAEKTDRGATEPVEGTLAIIFAHGDTDLRHEVPAVPG